ncbi:phage portal protein [Clostridia bacterium OttesenSCG-928-O13]|nr:phage portal protein [Clostridia bacterium OttesenSCG-928-O13]
MTLNSPTDHPKIGVDPQEYARILENMQVYSGRYPSVEYHNAKGELCTREFCPLNVVQFASARMATLLYNEKCRINIADEKAKAFIDELFERSSFNTNLQKYLEAEYAVGGLAIRPYYSNTAQAIRLSWCLPDRFFPLSSDPEETRDAVFITKTREVIGNKVYYYSLFEFHEWDDNGDYVITNELYESDTSAQIGAQVPLGTLEKYADLTESVTFSNLTRPLFVYIRPAQMNNLNPDSPLGLGMCDNAKYTIDTINITHDKLRRNIDRARSGVIVAPEYISTTQENGKTYQVNDDDDLFLAIPGSINSDPYKEITIKIEPDEFITAINFELRTFELQTGFSPGTFSFDGQSGLKTATEIVSENSMTYQTRSKQTVVLGSALKDLVRSTLELGVALGLYAGETDAETTVDFDDGVFQDKDAQLDYYIKATAGKLMPRSIAVARANNLSRKEAGEWDAMLKEEETARTTAASQAYAGITFGG